jgi:hypothetical protein
MKEAKVNCLWRQITLSKDSNDHINVLYTNSGAQPKPTRSHKKELFVSSFGF